ncbi:MAG: hypothetical protein WDW38_010410 [Sanguina aurantia]
MYAPGPLREQSKVTSPEMGTQHWYDIVVGGVTILRSAWFYPDTLPGRDNIRNHVTFATGVVAPSVSDGDATDDTCECIIKAHII